MNIIWIANDWYSIWAWAPTINNWANSSISCDMWHVDTPLALSSSHYYYSQLRIYTHISKRIHSKPFSHIVLGFLCERYTHCELNVLFPFNQGVVVVHCDSLVIHKKKILNNRVWTFIWGNRQANQFTYHFLQMIWLNCCRRLKTKKKLQLENQKNWNGVTCLFLKKKSK